MILCRDLGLGCKVLASNLKAGTSIQERLQILLLCPGVPGQQCLITILIQCRSLLAKEKQTGLLKDQYLGCLVSNVQILKKKKKQGCQYLNFELMNLLQTGVQFCFPSQECHVKRLSFSQILQLALCHLSLFVTPKQHSKITRIYVK